MVYSTLAKGILCYHCEKGFYFDGIRFLDAKTLKCMHCGKRIIKEKAEEYNG